MPKAGALSSCTPPNAHSLPMSTVLIALEGLTTTNHLPALEPLFAKATCLRMVTPLADARVAMLVSAMTGTWPDQHHILLAEPRNAGCTLRPSTASDRAQPTWWEVLDLHGLPTVSVGWPFAITGDTQHASIVDHTLTTHPAALRPLLNDCLLRPNEIDASEVAALAPHCKRVNQTIDDRLGKLAVVVAENVTRHATFLELLATQPWQCATLCLSLPAELACLEQVSEPLADDVFDGLTQRGLTLLNAFLAAIIETLSPETNIIIAGLSSSTDLEAPGFALLSGPAFQTPPLGIVTSLLDLAPLVWHACGFAAPAFSIPHLRTALAPAWPIACFTHRWQPAANLDGNALDRWLSISQSILKTDDSPVSAEEFAHFRALRIWGTSLMQRGQAKAALPVFTALTELAPVMPEAWLHLSEAQLRTGDYSAARDSVETAIRPDMPDDPRIWLVACEIELHSGHRDTARQHLARAEPLLTSHALSLQLPARLRIFLRDWPQARRHVEKMIAIVPHHDEFHTMLARICIGQGEWQSAAESAMTALQLNSWNARAAEILGHAHLGLKSRNQAKQAFTLATQLNPTWPRP